jgi:hypothetical protein
VDFVDSCATWLANQAAYQQTIADTVAAGLADVEPSDVEDVALATADGTGCTSQQLRNPRGAATSSAFSSVWKNTQEFGAATLWSRSSSKTGLATAANDMLLSYSIVVHKTDLTYAALASQLEESVSSGTMGDNLATYAVTYGITIPPGTGSFSQPDISNEFSPRPHSKSLSAAMIAMVVVGVVLGLFLVVVAVGYARQPAKNPAVVVRGLTSGGSMYSIVPTPHTQI